MRGGGVRVWGMGMWHPQVARGMFAFQRHYKLGADEDGDAGRVKKVKVVRQQPDLGKQ
jgi:hypothetical protein